jgi:hypothetical protein
MLQHADDVLDRKIVVHEQNGGNRTDEPQVASCRDRRQVDERAGHQSIYCERWNDAGEPSPEKQPKRLTFEDQQIGHKASAKYEEELDPDQAEKP